MISTPVRFPSSLLLLGFCIGSDHALVVDQKNQVFAEAGDKITITYLSSSAIHRGQIFSVYTPTAQVSIETSPSLAGDKINLDPFTEKSEIVFNLLDPHNGFSFYNDTRNNIDLMDHVRVTDLEPGKFLIEWRYDNLSDQYDDLVIIVEKSAAPAPVTEEKSAVSSWRFYE
jgi:hypothetical protein